jgi:hypothetical protein
VLPLKETETSVGPRFLGNSRTSYCLSFVYKWGYRTQSTRAVENLSAEPSNRAGQPDQDKRTFECPACNGVTTAIVKYR